MTIPSPNSIAITGRFREGRFREAKALRMCRIYREAVIHYSPGLKPWAMVLAASRQRSDRHLGGFVRPFHGQATRRWSSVAVNESPLTNH